MDNTPFKEKKQLLAKMKAEALEEQLVELTDLRQRLIAALSELDGNDVIASYRHTLIELVKAAGKNGIELALVKQALPDPVILQEVRDIIGTGSYIVGKGTPDEGPHEGEKWIIGRKGKTKGNAVTLYPGEKMKEKMKAAGEEIPVGTLTLSTAEAAPSAAESLD